MSAAIPAGHHSVPPAANQEDVMARKKNKKAQKDKRAEKDKAARSAQHAPSSSTAAAAPPAGQASGNATPA
jgi:hypothetical protein